MCHGGCFQFNLHFVFFVKVPSIQTRLGHLRHIRHPLEWRNDPDILSYLRCVFNDRTHGSLLRVGLAQISLRAGAAHWSHLANGVDIFEVVEDSPKGACENQRGKEGNRRISTICSSRFGMPRFPWDIIHFCTRHRTVQDWVISRVPALGRHHLHTRALRIPPHYLGSLSAFQAFIAGPIIDHEEHFGHKTHGHQTKKKSINGLSIHEV